MKFDYKIVRSKRKSISVSISSQNKITVRCPLSSSSEKIEEFVQSKNDWLEKHYIYNKKLLDSNEDIVNYSAVFINGRKVPLKLDKFKAVTENAVFVRKIGDLPSLYKDYFSEEFLFKVSKISQAIKLYPGLVFIKSYRGRWGCCDVNGNIYFDYRIFMLPERVQYYLIVHELCHLKFFNHSENFKNLVATFLPDWKERRRELKEYDFLKRLY